MTRENELLALSQKLEDAYEKVKLWPELRMPGVDITMLGEGFTDLLQLRNLVPEILATLRRKDGLGTVSVKPLEWDNQGQWWGSYAKTICGTYNVAQCRNTPNGDGVRNPDWFVSYPHEERLTIHKDEAEALATAEADFETRVKSSIGVEAGK